MLIMLVSMYLYIHVASNLFVTDGFYFYGSMLCCFTRMTDKFWFHYAFFIDVCLALIYIT